MMSIASLSKNTLETIQAQIDNKTKPLGALGALETLALQLALITVQRQNHNDAVATKIKSNDKISIENPTMIIFAGDHGINEEGLSIAPSDVTRQMVLNFLHGGAAINCFCQTSNIALTVVDCGILLPINGNEIPQSLENTMQIPKFVEHRLGDGTQNFSVSSAMSKEQVQMGFENGKQLINEQVIQGVEILLFGEMGIGNTSSAAALMSALTKYSVEECVGRGTGISDEQLAKKIQLIKQAISRVSLTDKNKSTLSSHAVMDILTEFGGFEIVHMVSAIMTAASASIPVVIDGFIVSVAALVAFRLDKNVANYLIFSHVSQEKAHKLLLNELIQGQNFTKEECQPLLDLGLRLGEGTGAALALPLIQGAANFYNNMASFESAGVTV